MKSDTEVLFPLRVAQAAAERVCHLLAPGCVRIEIAGEIRRLRPAVTQIDLLAIPKIETYEAAPEGDLFGDAPKVKKELHFLWEGLDRVVPQYLVKGEKQRSFMREDDDLVKPIRLNVWTCDRLNWGYMLLIRTGPEPFGAWVMSSLHKQSLRGYEGRVYHVRGADLRPVSEPISTPEEVDVFRLAGIRPVPPAQRSWQ